MRASGLPYTIVRCPLVLGCESAGVHVLAREIKTPVVPLPGGGVNLEQPIDARDVADGALNAALEPAARATRRSTWSAPSRSTLRELVQRAARALRAQAAVRGSACRSRSLRLACWRCARRCSVRASRPT